MFALYHDSRGKYIMRNIGYITGYGEIVLQRNIVFDCYKSFEAIGAQISYVSSNLVSYTHESILKLSNSFILSHGLSCAPESLAQGILTYLDGENPEDLLAYWDDVYRNN